MVFIFKALHRMRLYSIHTYNRAVIKMRERRDRIAREKAFTSPEKASKLF